MSIKKPFIIFIAFVSFCILGLVLLQVTREVNTVNEITLPARKISLKADLSTAVLKEYCFFSENEVCLKKGKLYLTPEGKAALYRVCNNENKEEKCTENFFPVYSEDKLVDLYNCDNIDSDGECEGLKDRRHFIYDDYENIKEQYKVFYNSALGQADIKNLTRFAYTGKGVQIYSRECKDISAQGKCLAWDEPIVNYTYLKPRFKNFKREAKPKGLGHTILNLFTNKIYDEQNNWLARMPRMGKLTSEEKIIPYQDGKKKIYCFIKHEEKCVLTAEVVLDKYGLGKSMKTCTQTNPDGSCKNYTYEEVFFYDGSGRRKSSGMRSYKSAENTRLSTKGEVYKYDEEDNLSDIIYCDKYNSDTGDCQEYDGGFSKIDKEWYFCTDFSENGICQNLVKNNKAKNMPKRPDITPPNIKYSLPDDKERWEAISREDGNLEIRFRDAGKIDSVSGQPLPEITLYAYGEDGDVEVIYNISNGIKAAQSYFIKDKFGNYLDIK